MEDLSFDFINSAWYSTHENKQDMLNSPTLLLTFLSKHKIFIKKIPDEKIIKVLNDMRNLLLASVKELAEGKVISQATIRKLNLYLSLSPCVRSAKLYNNTVELKVEPLILDWNWLLAELSADFIRFLNENETERLRICENPKCGLVFYDKTKNKTKRCCCEGCANLMKIRRYRANQKNTLGNH